MSTTTTTTSTSTSCHECAQPITDLDSAHWGHEDGCGGITDTSCQCDVWLHPECCHLCASGETHDNDETLLTGP